MKRVSLLALLFWATAIAGMSVNSSSYMTIGVINYADDHLSKTIDQPIISKWHFENSLKESEWTSKFKGFLVGQSGYKMDTQIEEAWVGYLKNGWNIKLGSQLIDWSYFDVFKLSDVINRYYLPTKFVDSVENPDKLGELSMSIQKQFEWGNLNLYLYPFLYDTPFSDATSRINPFHQSMNGAQFINGNDRLKSGSTYLQYATNINFTLDTSEATIYLIRQFDRRYPILDFDNQGRPTPLFLPFYQYGIAYRQVVEQFLFRAELAHRQYDTTEVQIFNGQSLVTTSQKNHTPLALGMEYKQAYDSGQESVFILEWQRILDLAIPERSALEVFQNDLFFGFVHNFNNVNNTKLELSIAADLDGRNEWFERLYISHSLNDYLKIKVGVAFIQAPNNSNSDKFGFQSVKDNSQAYAYLTYYIF